MKSFVLIGYRGSGKTTAGKALAQEMQLPFYDSDQRIIARLGRTIREFVEEEGWEAFRALEKMTLREIFNLKPGVVSLGGGAVLDPENRKLIREKGWTVWLKAEVPTLLKRMRADLLTRENRPSLSELDWEEETRKVLEQRTPMYQATADRILNTDGKTIAEVVEALVVLFSKLKKLENT